MHSRPGLIGDFRVWSTFRKDLNTNLLVVDPGGTTGLALYRGHANTFETTSVPLADLPAALAARVHTVDAIICEDFSIYGTRGDAKAPSAIGIGMCWQMSYSSNRPLFLFQPNMKASGRKRLDQAGLDARARAKNEHQRDVIDLVGKAVHELRKAL